MLVCVVRYLLTSRKKTKKKKYILEKGKKNCVGGDKNGSS